MPMIDPHPSLAMAMQTLSAEVAALRHDVRELRQAITHLDADLEAMRDKASAKHEEVVVLRTQHRVLWAVACVAGTSGLGALTLEILRMVQHP